MRALQGIVVAVWLVLGCPGVLTAQQEVPEPPDVPEGEDRVQDVVEGARAPFDGQLLDTDTAIRWLNRLRWYRNELGLQLSLRVQMLTAAEESHARQLRIVEESYQREITGLREDLRTQAERFARSQERAWYDTFGFGLVVGAVVIAAVVALSGWAFSSI